MLKPLRHFLPKHHLHPREITKLCYLLANKYCHEVCNVSCWADCASNTEISPYHKKYEEILQLVQCNNNSRVLEIGPGTGELLYLASKKAKSVIGIDLCPENVATCKSKGLEVIEGDAIKILDELPENSFDIIIANSSLEHAVTEIDALNKKADEIYVQMFKSIKRVLVPGGKAYLSLVYTNSIENPAELIQDPFNYPVFSKKFHLGLIVQTFSGWYPCIGQFDKCSIESGLKKIYEEDRTMDYLSSCKYWPSLCSIYNPLMAYKFFKNPQLRHVLFKYPYYCYLNVIKLLAQSWTWQFTKNTEYGALSPMRYLCQIWQK